MIDMVARRRGSYAYSRGTFGRKYFNMGAGGVQLWRRKWDKDIEFPY